MVYAIISVFLVAIWAVVLVRLLHFVLGMAPPKRRRIRRLCGLHAAKVMKRGEWAVLDTKGGCEVCRKIDDEFPTGGGGAA